MEKPPLANDRNGNRVQVPEEAANDVLVNLSEDESCVAKSLSVVSCRLKSKFCVAKIQGLINGKPAAMLVDTGSSVTIVSETLAKGCTLSPSVTVSQQQVTRFQLLANATLSSELARTFLLHILLLYLETFLMIVS